MKLPPNTFEFKGYYLSGEPSEVDTHTPSHEKANKLLRDLFDELRLSESRGSLKLLEKINVAIMDYPEIPQFKQYQTTWYMRRNDWDGFLRTTREMIEAYPNYIYGPLNLAQYYLEKEDPDQVKKILGETLKLRNLAPDRKIFHIKEYISFMDKVFRYALLVDDFDLAEECLDQVEELDDEGQATEALSRMLSLKRMERALKDLEENQAITQEAGYVASSYDKEIQTDRPPEFHHEEIQNLYQYDLHIPKNELQQILELPRKTLVEDLCEVLRDSIRRYEYYAAKSKEEGWKREEFEFVMHALCLLSELKAKEALPTIFSFLRQGGELLDFYLSDSVSEDIWRFIYAISEDEIAPWVSFAKEPGLYFTVRNTIFHFLTQLALHQPNRKAEVEQAIIDTLSFFGERIDDEHLIDPQFIGGISGYVSELRLRSCLPLIKPFFDKKLVNPFFYGDFSTLKEEIEDASLQPWPWTLFEDIFSFYENATQTWHYYREAEESTLQPKPFPSFSEKSFYQQETVRREGPKIGRNDPCPCGSGKKYKKCCLRK